MNRGLYLFLAAAPLALLWYAAETQSGSPIYGYQGEWKTEDCVVRNGDTICDGRKIDPRAENCVTVFHGDQRITRECAR